MKLQSLDFKLVTSAFLTLVSLFFISGTSIYRIKNIQKNSEEEMQLAKAMMTTQEIQLATIQVQQFLTDASLTGDSDSLTEAKKNYESGLNSCDDLLKKIPTLESRVTQLKDDLKNVYTVGTAMYEAYIKNGKDAGNKIMKDENSGFDKASKKLGDNLDQIITQTISQVTEHQKNSQKYIQDSFTILIIASLLFLALIVVSLVSVYRRIRPLGNIVHTIRNAGTQVGDAAASVSSTSVQLSKSSTAQSESVQKTAASLTEISAMVQSNVKVAESANQAATKIQTLSEDTKNSMENLVKAMNLILDSNKNIEELTKVISNIGEKTTVIDDIVFKTQLLSFNASVEAERAGEAGRGFSVVAQEVGALAQMSGEAAAEISKIVKQSVNDADRVAKDNKNRVEAGGKLAHEAKNKVIEVITGVNEILESTSKILSASQEQNQGVQEITTTVDILNRTFQETASMAEESSSASHELASQSQSLNFQVKELEFITTGDKSNPA